jgi:hypothetical protein
MSKSGILPQSKRSKSGILPQSKRSKSGVISQSKRSKSGVISQSKSSKSGVIAQPKQFYEKYSSMKDPHTIFLDFRPLVDSIKVHLDNEQLFTQHYNNEKTLLLQEFYFLKDLYYDDVIRFCAKFVDMMDIIIRKNTAQQFPDYFHRKRYFYYMEYCISKFPDIILFPTFDEIGATDLIKTRCVPVFFIGMTTNTTYADEYILTPSEFFFHDINHSRIIYQQDEAYIKEKRIHKLQLIDMMVASTNYYYSEIKKITDNKLIKLIKMLLFEIVHEDGFPLVNDKICERLLRHEGEDYVERMNGDVIESVKKITASTIGQTLFKLRCGFYDKEDEPMEFIVDEDYRTSDKIVKATQVMLSIFGCSYMSQKKLKILITENSSLTPFRKCLGDSRYGGKSRKINKNRIKINKTKRRNYKN